DLRRPAGRARPGRPHRPGRLLRPPGVPHPAAGPGVPWGAGPAHRGRRRRGRPRRAGLVPAALPELLHRRGLVVHRPLLVAGRRGALLPVLPRPAGLGRAAPHAAPGRRAGAGPARLAVVRRPLDRAARVVRRRAAVLSDRLPAARPAAGGGDRPAGVPRPRPAGARRRGGRRGGPGPPAGAPPPGGRGPGAGPPPPGAAWARGSARPARPARGGGGAPPSGGGGG